VINVFLLEKVDGDVYYSQNFIKRPPLGHIKCFFKTGDPLKDVHFI